MKLLSKFRHNLAAKYIKLKPFVLTTEEIVKIELDRVRVEVLCASIKRVHETFDNLFKSADATKAVKDSADAIKRMDNQFVQAYLAGIELSVKAKEFIPPAPAKLD